MKNWVIIWILIVAATGNLLAQTTNTTGGATGSTGTTQPAAKEKVLQFSGYALTADSLIGVPFAHITVLNRGRVATAGPDGFFSFAAREGDTLYFTSIGYIPAVYIIPVNLGNDKFSVIQLMTRTDLYMNPIIIYPWGDRSMFPQAFKDLRLPDDDIERAKKNLEREQLAEIGKTLEPDGMEAAQNYMRSTSGKTYYYGQTQPQNIFNPLAWAEFIKAWKRGDFKKKEKTSGSSE